MFNADASWNAVIGMHGSKEGYFCMRFNNPPDKYRKTFVLPLTIEGFKKAIDLLKRHDASCKTPRHQGDVSELVQNHIKGLKKQ